MVYGLLIIMAETVQAGTDHTKQLELGLVALGSVGFFGAFIAYLFDRKRIGDETASRRIVLLEALQAELGAIKKDEYISLSSIDPIRLVVPERLIDGTTFEYQKDKTLIAHIFSLLALVNQYNSYVQSIPLVLLGEHVRQLNDTFINTAANASVQLGRTRPARALTQVKAESEARFDDVVVALNEILHDIELIQGHSH